MSLRAALGMLVCVTLAACSTMETVELDDQTLTTANGVRFRVAMEGDGQCAYNTYAHFVGWGLWPSTVEQNGRIRKNPKFNFALPGDDLDSPAVRAAPLILEDFWGDAQIACALWGVAPDELKQVHRAYYEDAIKGFFEAATRFEAAAKAGTVVLLAEEDAMRAKYADLKTRRPDSLSLKVCEQTRVTQAIYRCPAWFHETRNSWQLDKPDEPKPGPPLP